MLRSKSSDGLSRQSTKSPPKSDQPPPPPAFLTNWSNNRYISSAKSSNRVSATFDDGEFHTNKFNRKIQYLPYGAINFTTNDYVENQPYIQYTDERGTSYAIYFVDSFKSEKTGKLKVKLYIQESDGNKFISGRDDRRELIVNDFAEFAQDNTDLIDKLLKLCAIKAHTYVQYEIQDLEEVVSRLPLNQSHNVYVTNENIIAIDSIIRELKLQKREARTQETRNTVPVKSTQRLIFNLNMKIKALRAAKACINLNPDLDDNSDDENELLKRLKYYQENKSVYIARFKDSGRTILNRMYDEIHPQNEQEGGRSRSRTPDGTKHSTNSRCPWESTGQTVGAGHVFSGKTLYRNRKTDGLAVRKLRQAKNGTKSFRYVTFET